MEYSKQTLSHALVLVYVML